MMTIMQVLRAASVGVIAVTVILVVPFVALRMGSSVIDGYHKYQCQRLIHRSNNSEITEKIEAWVGQYIFSAALKPAHVSGNGWPIIWNGGARYEGPSFFWSQFDTWQLDSPFVALFGPFELDQLELPPRSVKLVGLTLNYRRGYLVKRPDADFPQKHWDDKLTMISENVAVYCGPPRG